MSYLTYNYNYYQVGSLAAPAWRFIVITLNSINKNPIVQAGILHPH